MSDNGGPKKLIEFDFDNVRLPLQVFEAMTDEDVDMQHAFGMLGILVAEQTLLLKRIYVALAGEGKTTADEPVPLQENLFE